MKFKHFILPALDLVKANFAYTAPYIEVCVSIRLNFTLFRVKLITYKTKVLSILFSEVLHKNGKTSCPHSSDLYSLFCRISTSAQLQNL